MAEKTEEERQRDRGDFIMISPEEDKKDAEEGAEVDAEESGEGAEQDGEESGDAGQEDSGDGEESGEDGETSEEPDAEDEDDEPVAKKDKGKSVKVPKARLDKVIAQREAEKREREASDERVDWLESRLEELIDKGMGNPVVKEPDPIVSVYNFAEAEEKYAEHVMSGEGAKAAQLRTQINAEQTKAITIELTKNMQISADSNLEATKVAIEGAKFDSTVETLESEYPFLDIDSEDYNEEATDTINSLMTGYIQAGASKSEALRTAVQKMAPMYSKAKEEGTSEEGDEVKKSRKTSAKNKAVKTSNAQPPASGTGSKAVVGDTDILPSTMTDKQLRGLTAKERAILRGDIVG